LTLIVIREGDLSDQFGEGAFQKMAKFILKSCLIADRHTVMVIVTE